MYVLLLLLLLLQVMLSTEVPEHSNCWLVPCIVYITCYKDLLSNPVPLCPSSCIFFLSSLLCVYYCILISICQILTNKDIYIVILLYFSLIVSFSPESQRSPLTLTAHRCWQAIADSLYAGEWTKC